MPYQASPLQGLRKCRTLLSSAQQSRAAGQSLTSSHDQCGMGLPGRDPRYLANLPSPPGLIIDLLHDEVLMAK